MFTDIELHTNEIKWLDEIINMNDGETASINDLLQITAHETHWTIQHIDDAVTRFITNDEIDLINYINFKLNIV